MARRGSSGSTTRVLTVDDLLSRHGPVADEPPTAPLPVSRRPAPRSDGTAAPERGRSPRRAGIAVGVLLAAGSVLGVAVATTTTAPAVGSVPEVRVPGGGPTDPAPPGPGVAPTAPRVRVAFPGPAADGPAPDVGRSGDAGAPTGTAPDDDADERAGGDGPADDDRTEPGAGDDRTGDDDSPGPADDSADRDDDRGSADDGPGRSRDEDRPGRGGQRGRGGDGPRGGDDPTDLDDLVGTVVPGLR